MTVMPAASLRALLEHSIDYAGLFPPASLELEPALRNHAEYVRAPEAWMLGAFILPASRFEAASVGLSQFDQKHPWHISVLGTKTGTATDFHGTLEKTMGMIRDFSECHSEMVSIDQLEMPLPAHVNANVLAEAGAVVGDLTAYWEAPADAVAHTIALLADAQPFGFKLRTGGVTAEAFPSSRQIATALVAAAKHRVAIKFTAGLHHPIRQYREEVQTKMHGFLNVLGAGMLAIEHGWDEQQAAAMLEDESPASFTFDDNFFAWREWKIATDRIAIHRKLVTSFGSCSFDEPREDLRALNLL
jgi:hypothetical protein